MSTQIDLIIAGAGPAGLMAAISAAQNGAKVIVLESMAKPARKLGISGKGRGNLTNTAPMVEFLRHFNNHGRFLKPAFHLFFSHDLIEFFRAEGLETVEERGGRVFTASGRATDAVRCLERAAKRRGVEIITSESVTGPLISDESCLGLAGRSGRSYRAKQTLIATGGLSYPLTGSTGDGLEFARNTNHRIVPTHPSLVALKPKRPIPSSLNGLLLKNVAAQLRINNKKVAMEFGEMTFSEGFLAGPIVITLSRKAVPFLSPNNQTNNMVEIWLDLKPALSHEKLDARLLREIQPPKGQQPNKILGRLLPKQMHEFCIQSVPLPSEATTSPMSAKERKSLRNWLKQVPFEISGTAPWSHSIVTTGGVATEDIDPQTLQSKRVNNLYFAGEMIDIDADTGGFNLQAAFSTGWLAGKSAAIACYKQA